MLRSVSSLRSPVVSSSGGDTELMKVGATWQRAVATAAVADNCPHDDEAMLAAFERLNELERFILAAPVSTARGVALKAAVVRRQLDLHYDRESDEPACLMARALIDAITSLDGSPAAPGVARVALIAA